MLAEWLLRLLPLGFFSCGQHSIQWFSIGLFHSVNFNGKCYRSFSSHITRVHTSVQNAHASKFILWFLNSLFCHIIQLFLVYIHFWICFCVGLFAILLLTLISLRITFLIAFRESNTSEFCSRSRVCLI